jgi:hypothetical protein
MLADVPTTSSFFFRIESIVGPAAATDTKHNHHYLEQRFFHVLTP